MTQPKEQGTVCEAASLADIGGIGFATRQIYGDPAHREALSRIQRKKSIKNRSKQAEQAMLGMLGKSAKDKKKISETIDAMEPEQKERLAGLRTQSPQKESEFSSAIDEALARNGIHLVVNGGNVTINVGNSRNADGQSSGYPARNWGGKQEGRQWYPNNRGNYYSSGPMSRVLRGIEGFINGR